MMIITKKIFGPIILGLLWVVAGYDRDSLQKQKDSDEN